MILSILHALQWAFIVICAPLLGFLLYALFKEWKKGLMPTLETEYKRGYTDGYADGYDAARQDIMLTQIHEDAMNGDEEVRGECSPP